MLSRKDTQIRLSLYYPTDSFTFAITNSVSVLAWVDGSKIIPDPSQLPPGDPLPGILGSAPNCAASLLGMSAAGMNNQVNVVGLLPAEIAYVNQFIVNGSANPSPPSQDPGYSGVSGYRIYQQFQSYYEVSNGSITSGTTQYFSSPTPLVGSSPEPCTGYQFSLFSQAAQPNAANGTFGLSADGSTLYQINEGRVGTAGQGVNYYLNGTPGQSYTQATPWIWSVVRFGPAGTTLPFTVGDNLQIFPSYQIYVNGSATTSLPQGSLAAFIALNATSQYQVNQ